MLKMNIYDFCKIILSYILYKMASLKSMLNKVISGITGLFSMKKDSSKIVILLIAVVAVVYLYNNMQLPKLGMASGRSKTETNTVVEQGVKPVQTSPEEQYTKVQGLATDTHGLAPSCNGGDKVNPMDLLAASNVKMINIEPIIISISVGFPTLEAKISGGNKGKYKAVVIVRIKKIIST